MATQHATFGISKLVRKKKYNDKTVCTIQFLNNLTSIYGCLSYLKLDQKVQFQPS